MKYESVNPQELWCMIMRYRNELDANWYPSNSQGAVNLCIVSTGTIASDMHISLTYQSYLTCYWPEYFIDDPCLSNALMLLDIGDVVFSTIAGWPQGNHTADCNDSNTYVIDSIYRFTSICTAVGARGKLLCGFTGVRRIEFAILIAYI